MFKGHCCVRSRLVPVWRHLLSFPFLAPLNGETILAGACCARYPLPCSAVLAWRGAGAGTLWQRCHAPKPTLALALLASSALVGVQLWLFMWHRCMGGRCRSRWVIFAATGDGAGGAGDLRRAALPAHRWATGLAAARGGFELLRAGACRGRPGWWPWATRVLCAAPPFAHRTTGGPLADLV